VGLRCVITFPVQAVVRDLHEVDENQERYAS
jgi:hypothetical protein